VRRGSLPVSGMEGVAVSNFEIIMALLRYGLVLLCYLILLGLAGFAVYLVSIRVLDRHVKASCSKVSHTDKRRRGNDGI